MVAPNKREVAVVSAIEQLDEASVERLMQVTTALGYNNELLAEILKLGSDDVRQVFSGERPLSGLHLLKLCQTLKLRPGVVQGLRNFDADETSVGSKVWQGPHDVFVKGHHRLGGFVKACLLNFRNMHGLTTWEVNQIGNGNRPVSLGLVVELLNAVPKKTGGMIALERAVQAMPKQVVTAQMYVRSKTAQNQTGNEVMIGTKPAIEMIWDKDKDQVRIGEKTYSLKPGLDMAAVAARIRALIERDASKPKIGEVLNIALGREEYSNVRAKVLASVEKGNGTFPAELIQGVAKYFNIPAEALFTGVGLGFSDPVGDESTASGGDEDLVIRQWCRDQLLTRGTKLVPDIDPYDLVDFARRADDMSIEWVKHYLEMTVAGADLKKYADEVSAKTALFGPNQKSIFWKLLKDAQ